MIEQGGVIRAPLGNIMLGAELGQSAQRVALLPGSITSVSGAGLVMPYGGTTDGIAYQDNGRAVALKGAGGGAGIRLGAELVACRPARCSTSPVAASSPAPERAAMPSEGSPVWRAAR